MKQLHSIYLLGFIAMTMGISACGGNVEQQSLPILGQPQIMTEEVNGETISDTIQHQIPDFEFLNQDSVYISNTDFTNGIYIANFFFTHCPSICPTMQRNLLNVYKKYYEDERVKFLSHSIDFKYDSPEVLKTYAVRLGVTNDQWQFVTGDRKAIYGIAQDYLSYAEEDENAPGGYEHSGYMVLVDHNRHIRGAYDGTSNDQIHVMLNDIEILLKEYE